ncbi:hypothetical protein CRYUN_Cryun38cG0059000 [Craigia yunnanensis]
MAAEFVASAAANTVGNLATECALPCLSYFFHFGKIVDDFKLRRNQLELKIDRVKNDVDAAIRQTDVVEKDVEDWLTRAEKELREAQSLDEEIERKKCFTWCPNWGWRCLMTKKVAKKTLCISKILETSDFQRVGYHTPLQGIEFFPSKDFMPCESSISTFKEIIRAINTNGVNMIGLYGMPGVGKTTLATEVGKHVKEQKLFDYVVMITMSQNPNINKIQDKIAELLGLKFEASTEEVKAEVLWRRLKGVKILIIIDDVWNEFKLQTIGIPFDDEHDVCKILLTTRRQQVCVQMNCQEKFQLNILSEDEAWALFKDNAGLKDVSSTLNDVAKEVSRECKGLPLAIVIIGKSLKGATLNRWKATNMRLKDSRHSDNEDVCEGIYNRLQLSYDYLKGDNIRSCFLLCALFPEDCDIDIESLMVFGIGYGLFSNIYLIEDLRREIDEALRKLQESSLLLKPDDGGDDVRMHDVIRDFAHWITSKDKTIFMVKDGLTEWPLSETFGYYTAIAFWNSKINNFPDKLEFSKLKILVFTGKNLVRVPSAFVKGMKVLRVLHFENVVFSLENISSLGNVENLEILALLDTNIYELPKELAALRRLKSLFFSLHGEQQTNFPPNLLSRSASLQELHVRCKNNVNLSELNSLSRLTALSLRVSTNQCFPKNFVFPKLQRYSIAVNKDVEDMEMLTLKINDISSLSPFKELFCNVKKLVLENVTEHKNIVPNIDQDGLNELTSLLLRYCKDLEYLMDPTVEKRRTTAFSNLVELNMEGMTCLKELCHGPPPISFLLKLKDVVIKDCEQLKVVFQMDGVLEKEEISQTPLFSNLTSLDLWSLPELESIWKLQPTQYHVSLQSLKVVSIRKCNELKSIFSTCVAQSLLHLKEVDIYDCYELQEIFDFPQETAELEENQVPSLSNLTCLELSSLPKLSCIWKGPTPTHLVNIRSLKTMRINGCLKLTYLFPTPLAQRLMHLEVLEMYNCDSLEHVIIEEAGNGDEIVSNMDDSYPLYWPKLRTLKIIGCRSLKYVFPITSVRGLQNLQSIELTNSSQLKQVFNMTKEKGGGGLQDIVLQGLQILKLENLENLTSFCAENFVMSVSLKKFEVHNCPRLSLTRLVNQGVALEPEFELSLSAAKYYPSLAVTELVEGDSSRKIVEIICRTSWLKYENHCGRIERVLKVHNMQKTLARFQEYREMVKIKASKLPKKHPRCIADGNELLRFYGTTVACSLGLNGSSSLCVSEKCCVCRIIRNGFSAKKELKEGIGVFTTSTSGRAFESIQILEDDPSIRKALIVCTVIARRVHKPLENIQEMAGQTGFDSLAGKVGLYSNIKELYLLNPRVLLPCFVVICKP